MTHNIIKTENYLLVVDDSEIKEGDYRVNIQRGYVKLVDDAPEYYNQRNDVFKKVIAHLPLNNSPILEGVDLLPPLEQEDDVEKLALYWYNKSGKLSPKITEITAFKSGYNKAKEKYKYTEEDLRKAWNAAYIDAMSIDEETYKPLFFEDFIQSLSQPKMPIGFECQTFDTGDDKLDGTHVLGIRTTTNPQGQTQWVGKYIY